MKLPVADKRASTDRIVAKILLRYKGYLIRAKAGQKKAEAEINAAIEDFVQRTGCKVANMTVAKVEGKFEITLEIE